MHGAIAEKRSLYIICRFPTPHSSTFSTMYWDKRSFVQGSQSIGGGGAANTSRLPFDPNGPTRPLFSISSTILAARL